MSEMEHKIQFTNLRDYDATCRKLTSEGWIIKASLAGRYWKENDRENTYKLTDIALACQRPIPQPTIVTVDFDISENLYEKLQRLAQSPDEDINDILTRIVTDRLL